MKQTFYLCLNLVFLLLTTGRLSAQDGPAALGLEPEAISVSDQYVLSRIPLLELPDAYKGPNAPLVPFSIDNSTQPYFRSITSQSGYECGQSAGVAFNFTYEIDRLRNLPASNPNNQYPTHFVWDFLNSGGNYVGASFFDSWEIVRACGTMNVTDYGGTLNFGGYKRWISGYDAYYNGMKNRMNWVKAIRVDSPEGLQTLKYWLWDHLEGSAVGGVANFYANYYSSAPTVLPAGTPEAGKYVQTSWGPSPSHAWTVCGFNDSIRWDYNNDGQYTNTIDITGDGVVDMHDWEIGGLKFANGYAGTGWCNQGFCYLMYKTLADNIGYGGIWNHTVYVIDVKESCDPQLTMKVTLKHTSRYRLKVTVGMSANLSATTPDHVYEYPIFNHQGGDFYPQGGTSEADKTIEFGLDLTPVLSDLTSGQPAKFFLQVEEIDPGNACPGEIVQMALIDYTSSTPQTIACASTNFPLANNTITRLSVNHAVVFSKPAITTGSLPVGQLYQPYAVQLAAGQGTPPYRWDVQLTYPETVSAAPFPTTATVPLVPTNANTGFAVQELPFPFPFYDRVVQKLYIYVDGYILFDDQPYTYPYLIDPTLLFRQTPILSPFMSDLRLYYNLDDGIWYEGDANSATIRWKASVNNQAGTTTLNFAVKFYPNGQIDYYFGPMNYPAGTSWTGGMSSGDNRNYQYSQYHNAASITAGTMEHFNSCGYPVEMELSETGLFSGIPQYAYFNQPITFRVSDNNGISNTKTLQFSTNGLLVDHTITSGGDSLIEYGELALVSFTITNLGSQPVTGVDMWMTENDPYITLVDSLQYIGTINGGQTLTFPDAFSFQVSSQVPNGHEFTLTFHEISNQQNFQMTIHLTAFSPDVMIGQVVVQDGDNGQLDPGETSNLIVAVENLGGAKVSNLTMILTSMDPLLGVNLGTATVPLLNPGSIQYMTFNLTASPQAPFYHLYLLSASLSGASGFTGSDSLWLFSGEIIEDFETANFCKFPWYFGGEAGWNIDQFEPYEGTFCIKSGWIYENMESHFLLNANVLASSEIRFWKRVSCEDDPNGTDYDYLAFYIDDVEMDRWDGNIPWEEVSYPVTKGYHTFKWAYHKDHSISGFYDCCWIDFISLPPFEGALPVAGVNPEAITKILDPGQAGQEPLEITNLGGGLLNYTVQVFDTSATKEGFPEQIAGTSITCSESTCMAGQPFNWTFTVHNASADDEYLKQIRMEFPAQMTVSEATNFSGGSLGDLICDGTTGTGVTLTWTGESTGGRGVIKPDETAVAVVNGTLEPNQPFDVFIVYMVYGDSAGSSPHAIPGTIRVAKEGLPNTWLQLSSSSGSLLPGYSEEITLSFHTTGLSSGDYTCDLLVRDQWNNISTVPVLLHINWPVELPDQAYPAESVSCFPNPFSGSATITYHLQEQGPVRMTISDVKGTPVKTFRMTTDQPGMYSLQWDACNDQGIRLSPGLYTLRFTTTRVSHVLKLMIVR